MARAEFWVARVLLHHDAQLSLSAEVAVQPAVDAGELVQLPDGSIAERVELFQHEADARIHREVLKSQNPSEDYRVLQLFDLSDCERD